MIQKRAFCVKIAANETSDKHAALRKILAIGGLNNEPNPAHMSGKRMQLKISIKSSRRSFWPIVSFGEEIA
jgi:hypothetical protein